MYMYVAPFPRGPYTPTPPPPASVTSACMMQTLWSDLNSPLFPDLPAGCPDYVYFNYTSPSPFHACLPSNNYQTGIKFRGMPVDDDKQKQTHVSSWCHWKLLWKHMNKRQTCYRNMWQTKYPWRVWKWMRTGCGMFSCFLVFVPK